MSISAIQTPSVGLNPPLAFVGLNPEACGLLVPELTPDNTGLLVAGACALFVPTWS